MAAPTPTPRGYPSGIELKDGWSSRITLAVNVDIAFWEKTFPPPGMDGGEPIDFSTMFNVAYHTFWHCSLIKMDAIDIDAAYDPKLYEHIIACINVPTTITVTWPNADTLAFYGWLQKVTFDKLEQGKLPMCKPTFFPSNYDYLNSVEAAPAFHAATGT